MIAIIVCGLESKLFSLSKGKSVCECGTRSPFELFWRRLKSYVELVPADPNIPNGILSTGDNLKCLKRLTAVQTAGAAASVTDSDLEIMPMQN